MENRKSEAAKILLENGFELEEVNNLLNPIKLLETRDSGLPLLPGAYHVPPSNQNETENILQWHNGHWSLPTPTLSANPKWGIFNTFPEETTTNKENKT
jgi:hypothetical protein